MGKLFSKSKTPKQNLDRGFDSLDQAGGVKGQGSHMKRNQHHYQPEEPAVRELIHTEPVTSLAKIQPGLCIAGSKDKTVTLYDYNNHRLEDRWTGHERDVTKVCYGSHCQGIFSASRDKTVKLWRRGNAHPIREYCAHELVVSAIHLNKDNSLLCSGSRDNTIKLWDVETGQLLRESRISRNLVTDVKFIPDSNLLIQTGEDKEVRLFDSRTMSVSHSFPKKQYIQMCCDVTNDGHFCLTCSNGFNGHGCEATLWDIRALQIVHEYRGHTQAVESCIFMSSKGRDLIATTSRDCTVRVWDQHTRDSLMVLDLPMAGNPTSLIAYEDDSICVSTFNTGIARLQLDLDRGNLQMITNF